MDKTKVGQLVVLIEKIGDGCQTVYVDTIGKVNAVLDATHVELSFTKDCCTLRNANVLRFRLPVDAEEAYKFDFLWEKTNIYNRAKLT
jgi:hypothetical protein